MRIFVPSYGRPEGCSSLAYLPSAMVVVPESQAESYRRSYGSAVVAIPNDKDGSAPKKRNALLDLAKPDELIWMIDDDLIRIFKIKGDAIFEIEELLEAHWNLMEEMGICFGGFSIYSDPAKYAEYAPLSFTKPSYQCVAIRNIGLRYDESLGRFEDVDMFLQIVHQKHMVLRDNRYFFEFECNKDKAVKKQVGGIEGNEAAYQDAMKRLVQKWGSVIKVKDGKVNGAKSPLKGP